MLIKIRFNTEKEKHDSVLPAWRVFYGEKEYFAEELRIEVGSWTSKDVLEDGRIKWQIHCEGTPRWVGTTCLIE